MRAEIQLTFDSIQAALELGDMEFICNICGKPHILMKKGRVMACGEQVMLSSHIECMRLRIVSGIKYAADAIDINSFSDIAQSARSVMQVASEATKMLVGHNYVPQFIDALFRRYQAVYDLASLPVRIQLAVNSGAYSLLHCRKLIDTVMRELYDSHEPLLIWPFSISPYYIENAWCLALDGLEVDKTIADTYFSFLLAPQLLVMFRRRIDDVKHACQHEIQYSEYPVFRYRMAQQLQHLLQTNECLMHSLEEARKNHL